MGRGVADFRFCKSGEDDLNLWSASPVHLYETTVIADSLLKPDDMRDLREKIASFISNHGGEVQKAEEWGKRRLAYEIAKKQYGYYLHFRFTAPEALAGLLEREYRLNESILRFLTIRVEKIALQHEARLTARAAAKEPEGEQRAVQEAV
jgi:small subunit ribosomal protein S6